MISAISRDYLKQRYPEAYEIGLEYGEHAANRMIDMRLIDVEATGVEASAQLAVSRTLAQNPQFMPLGSELSRAAYLSHYEGSHKIFAAYAGVAA